MTRPAILFATACLLAAMPCVAQQLNDPANLAGEHVSPQALADDLPINHGAPALQQLLLKLRTRASMMFIVAHPDDEDGGMLTYESRGFGARVAMLTLTRGEGGQNLMSADFDDALGLIRTQELLAEDRYTGVDQFFGTEVDFGFSKTKEETLAKWTHDRVLYDAVRCVRLYRPLVIASTFVGGPTDGHGHHQVAGEIAQEVFVAAADPKVFPEMGLAPWAPLKVYARVPFSRVSGQGMFDYATGKTIPILFHNYVTGVDSHLPPTATVQIHEGDPAVVFGKPALGMDGLSYVQFARRGLALQKTQIGPGVRTAPPGRSDSGYTLMGSRLSGNKHSPNEKLSSFAAGGGPVSSLPATESSIFEGIDTSFPAIAGLAPHAPPTLRTNLAQIDNKLAEAQHLFDPANVAATAPPLREALKTLNTVIDGTTKAALPQLERANLLHELRVKRVQLNNALVLALGVMLTAKLNSDSAQSDGSVVPGSSHKIRIEASGLQPAILENATVNGPASDLGSVRPNDEMNHSRSVQFLVGITFSSTTPVTRPYFSRPDLEQPFYNVTEAALRNAPVTPAPVTVNATLAADDTSLFVSVAVKGTNPQPPAEAVVLVPAYSLDLSPRVEILPKTKGSFLLAEQVVPFMPGSNSTLHVPSGWTVHPEPSANPPNELTWETSLIEVNKPPSKPVVIPITVTSLNGRSYSEGFRLIGYPGLTHTNYFKPSVSRVIPVDVTTAPDLHIAYLPGTGDDVPAYLPNLGVTPTVLSVKDLTLTNLKQYDAIILGVRAYAAHPELAHAGSQPLNDFAAGGGVVIVQYNSGGDATGTAPYPYDIPGDSAHNVVVEAQPVTVLEPNAPLLNWPNKITSDDFHNWVAEYGHGFASTWANEYQPLIEVHDPDQDPQKGGLLVAQVGKGAYIYCALALYRQLPEGVPGAYRLFANLLSYAHNPNRPH